MKSFFRYPGAKAKLLQYINPYIDSLINNATDFADVFVGGGSVLLDVATRYPNIILHANDKDKTIYSFWKIVAGNDINKLDTLLDLMSVQPTIELFNKLRNDPSTLTDVDLAYRGIFFNRTTFSGIAYSGPIGGKSQSGKYKVDCRYNFKKLKDRILKANKLLSGRTNVTNDDFIDFNILKNTTIPVYLDPPYFKAGDSLYLEKMNYANHKQLADLLKVRPNWILSYDSCPEIIDLYKYNKIIDLAARYCINGKKENWKNKNELIIMGN